MVCKVQSVVNWCIRDLKERIQLVSLRDCVGGWRLLMAEPFASLKPVCLQ